MADIDTLNHRRAAQDFMQAPRNHRRARANFRRPRWQLPNHQPYRLCGNQNDHIAPSRFTIVETPRG